MIIYILALDASFSRSAAKLARGTWRRRFLNRRPCSAGSDRACAINYCVQSLGQIFLVFAQMAAIACARVYACAITKSPSELAAHLHCLCETRIIYIQNLSHAG